MKLVDLLEQGKKARVEDFVYDYIYFNKDNNCILTDRNEVYAFGLDDLTREDWFEYEEYRTNFDISSRRKDYYVVRNNHVMNKVNNYQSTTNEELSCFNAFDDKNFAEYVQKRQLLDRQLMIFSHLNGGDEIEWNCIDSYYYIDVYYDIENGLTDIQIENNRAYKINGRVYFKTKETAKKALEIYGKDMEEVFEMSIKLGF